jgi:hypothetical protein
MASESFNQMRKRRAHEEFLRELNREGPLTLESYQEQKNLTLKRCSWIRRNILYRLFGDKSLWREAAKHRDTFEFAKYSYWVWLTESY